MTETHPKCLLVDDDETMLTMLSQCVEALGFEPVVAHDGDEGFSAFREVHPNLVVSDIHMPNRNGLLLLNDIKSANPNVPVILITGWLHYRAAINMETAKPDAFMEKPFSIGHLQKTIEGLRVEIERAWDKEL
ncbi:response regulator [bacterium]|nr:response regulator [bacterium]MBU1636650.1 response regulator [bacterium]MBU1920117.1 response regulator [bacterium]